VDEAVDSEDVAAVALDAAVDTAVEKNVVADEY
jgi:hypothetical protein